MIKSFLTLVLVLSAVGCAGPSLDTAQRSELQKLRERNELLEHVIQARSEGRNQGGPSMMVPPIGQRDFLAGVRQDVGSMYGPMERCGRGGRSIAIHNSFDPNFIRPRIDGQPIHVLGAGGEFPALPPGKTVWICVRSGHHVVSADALEPDGLTLLDGSLETGSIEFATGSEMQNLYFEKADFALSN